MVKKDEFFILPFISLLYMLIEFLLNDFPLTIIRRLLHLNLTHNRVLDRTYVSVLFSVLI